MLVYATVDDLRDFLGLAPEAPTPARAQELLEWASSLVTRAIGGAKFPVGSNGYPSNPDHLEACKTATLRQTGAWVLNGIDPTTGIIGAPTVVGSKSMDGVTVQYANAAEQAAAHTVLAAGVELTGGALLALDEQGLLATYIVGPQAPRHGLVYPYDPITGRML